MDEITGLGNTPRSEWPKAPEPGTQPIDILKPGSDEHATVLEYLMVRLEASERAMTDLHRRWEVNEKKVQAYIDLRKNDKILEEMNNKGRPPQAVEIIVPYAWATLFTIVTYLSHTFCGRKPILQITSNKSDFIDAAKNMETVIQYQADHTRLVRMIYQFLCDGQMYGLGVLKPLWEKREGKRTYRRAAASGGMGAPSSPQMISERKTIVTYEGNMVESVDPFMFFPDPKVPMVDVNKRGEFCFARSYQGKHALKKLEAVGRLKWVDAASSKLPKNVTTGDSGASARAFRSQGEAHPGARDNSIDGAPYYQTDQGTIEIIPRELGLGEGTVPEKWIFTVLNKSQIVQAEPFDADHDMHPFCVSEPTSLGYGFGQLATTDMIGPLQDLLSWLINSHIYNVRTSLNNMFVVDPSLVEMQDLRNPEPGKIIRLKRPAFGIDVRTALGQLQVADVTGAHMGDVEKIMRIGQYLTAVTDNVMGLQDQGGRKTATEVRTSGEAAASRLAAMARLISSQALVDLAMQMSLNTQQYLSDSFYMDIVGQDQKPLRVTPAQISGDFHFPIHDGTLPLDKVALLEVWKEILIGTAQTPLLAQNFDIVKIFEWTAELGGAKNISEFKIKVAPPGAEMPPGALPIGNGAGAPVAPAPLTPQ